MEAITYALYSTSAGDILPQGVLTPGVTLKDAYLSALDICNTMQDPNSASLDILIWAMQKDPVTGELEHKYDYTIPGAYKHLQQTEIAKAAKIEYEKEAVVEDEIPLLYFRGSFYELIGLLNSISTEWDEQYVGTKVLNAGDGSLIWNEESGLMQFHDNDLLEETVRELFHLAGIDMTAVEEEPEAVIPSTSIAPWSVSGTEYTDAFGINDSDGNLITLVVNNHITEEHAETNARLISIAPELQQLTMGIFQAIINKAEEARTIHESDFMYGIISLFGEEDLQVDVGFLGTDERLVLLTFVENYMHMHDTINMLRQHGVLTPEIMQDLTDAQMTAQESLIGVRTQLL